MNVKFKLDNLRKIVINKGLSIKELAQESGLTRHTISRVLNKDVGVSHTTVGKIAKVLGVDSEEISEIVMD